MPEPYPSHFLGPAYVARSGNLAYNQLINLYLEMVEMHAGKSPGGFYMTPGLDSLANLGTGPINAIKPDNTGKFLYVVSGITLYKVAQDFSSTNLGTFTGSIGGRMSPITGFNQMGFSDGQSFYVSDHGAPPVQIVMPFPGPFILSYQDTFGLAAFQGTNQWAQSNSLDLTTWKALNFSSADSQPDNIIAIQELHREQYLFKQNNTEVWVNAGNQGFAFQRLEGVFIEAGCAAPFSVSKAGENLFWLGQTTQGSKVIYMLHGYSPVRISTHAIEFAINKYTSVSDCFSYAYQQEGHTFVVFTFPSGDETWVYDVTDSQLGREPLWHKRAAFSNGQFHRHLSNNYAYFAGRNVVGDWQSGNLYAFNLDTLTDAGTQRKWLRSWLAGAQTGKLQRFNELRIDMESGIAVPPTGNPQAVLRYSDDDGHTWSFEEFQPAGRTGVTAPFVKFRRLGSLRRNAGYDRIFELSSTDQFKVALIGAELS